MKKRTHKLLASCLLKNQGGFPRSRFEWAFLFGSFEPDCNPLTYLKGSIRARIFQGHCYSNSKPYIENHIYKLQRRQHWTMWQYYTLGKLTHYLADAFTYPHNEIFHEPLLRHRSYEDELRQYMAEYLAKYALPTPDSIPSEDITREIYQLHEQYLRQRQGIRSDAQYIIQATLLLMVACLPVTL